MKLKNSLRKLTRSPWITNSNQVSIVIRGERHSGTGFLRTIINKNCPEMTSKIKCEDYRGAWVKNCNGTAYTKGQKRKISIFFSNPGFSAIISLAEGPWEGFLVKNGSRPPVALMIFDRSRSDPNDYWLLHFAQLNTQLVRNCSKFDYSSIPIQWIFENKNLLSILLNFWTFHFQWKCFTNTLGKIHFLLCFACFVNLWNPPSIILVLRSGGIFSLSSNLCGIGLRRRSDCLESGPCPGVWKFQLIFWLEERFLRFFQKTLKL